MKNVSSMYQTFIAVFIAICMYLFSSISYADPTRNISKMSIVNEHNEVIKTMTIGDLKSTFKEVEIVTKTPWSNNKYNTYIGVRLLDILEKYALDKYDNIEGFAANDFSARISLQDIREFNPILAYGKKCPTKDEGCEEGSYVPLTIKDSGPIYLVWPFDDLPEGVDPRDHSKWVWYIVGVKPVA